MDFWQWLVSQGLIQGDPTYYSSGAAQDWEYGHAITIAFQNTIANGTKRKALIDALWASGLGFQGDKTYWYTMDRMSGEVSSLANQASQGFPVAVAFGDTVTVSGVTGPGTTATPPASSTPPEPTTGGSVPDTPDPTDTDGDGVPDVGGSPISAPDVPDFDYYGAARLIAPWLPEALIGTFADAWAEYGSADLGLAAVRNDPSYDSYFPGIKRDDGSLRMTEQEYLAQKDAYRILLLEYGLNPGIFEGSYTDLIAGDVSAAEFAQRLEAAYTQVVTNFDEVRQVYSQYYGIDMTDEAIYASFLDEEVGQAILERRIAVSQVGGAAAVQSFGIGEDYAARLVNAGLSQQSALQFFGQASNEIPTLQRLATRYSDPDSSVDIEEYTEFGVFQNAQQTQRFRRLRAAESSAFTPQELVRFGEGGELTGLRQR